MNTNPFSIRRLYPRSLCRTVLLYLEFALVIFLAQYPFYRGFVAIRCSLVVCEVQAQDAPAAGLYFATELPWREIKLPVPKKGYWLLPGGNDHQNNVLQKYQDALRLKGIEDEDTLKYASALIVHENEKLTTDRLGDSGHSFGICQKNLGRGWAADFLAKNPEWDTVDKQVEYCADRFASALKTYKTTFRAVVEHNCPACAEAAVDACYEGGKRRKVCYFQRVVNATFKLSLL